jgi:hypothetical protein
MKAAACLVVIASCLAAPARAQDALAAAQALYSAAQYEEALKAFDGLKSAGSHAVAEAIAIENGRAGCLLALDRKADAEQAIEQIVGLDPFFKPTEDDTSPKVRAVFREVRRRVLPAALQQVYGRAKAAYERRNYEEALTGFKQSLALLEDPDLVLDASARSDLKLVAKAFEDLVVAASTRPPEPPPTAAKDQAASSAPTGAPAAPPAAAPGETAANPVYDASAKDVTPPVAVRTDVQIPDSLRRRAVAGDVLLDVIVAAAGTVESAVARQAGDSLYGTLVARAALDWRYRPATKAGTPVRYRLIVRVVPPAR